MLKKFRLPVLLLIGSAGLLIAINTVIYQIDGNRCWNCGRCTWHCPHNAIQFNPDQGHFYIVPDLCDGCGICVSYCPYGAIYSITPNADEVANNGDSRLQCVPNPASEYTEIRYEFPEGKHRAALEVFNSKGRLVFREELQKTKPYFRWQGTDLSNKRLPSGLYYVTVNCGEIRTTNKVTLVH